MQETIRRRHLRNGRRCGNELRTISSAVGATTASNRLRDIEAVYRSNTSTAPPTRTCRASVSSTGVDSAAMLTTASASTDARSSGHASAQELRIAPRSSASISPWIASLLPRSHSSKSGIASKKLACEHVGDCGVFDWEGYTVSVSRLSFCAEFAASDRSHAGHGT
jgi:hypothetical protein